MRLDQLNRGEFSQCPDQRFRRLLVAPGGRPGLGVPSSLECVETRTQHVDVIEKGFREVQGILRILRGNLLPGEVSSLVAHDPQQVGPLCQQSVDLSLRLKLFEILGKHPFGRPLISAGALSYLRRFTIACHSSRDP